LERLLLLLGSIGVRGEVDNLNLEGTRLLQFLDSCLNTQLQKVDLTRETGTEMIVNALHVSRDLHFQRRSDSGEL
jgi:hypothetical protein